MARKRNYSVQDVNRLVSGALRDRVTGRVVEADGCWAGLRSSVETTGLLPWGIHQSEAFLEVLDLERVVSNLRRRHPVAGAAVILTLWGWDRLEVEELLRLRTPYGVLLNKAKAYIAADLAGHDAESAYRRGRWPDDLSDPKVPPREIAR